MNDSRTTGTVHDLLWIDEFVQKVKPYIYVRKMDRLLILIPNQAYRLNASGITILHYLLQGNSIKQFCEEVNPSTEQRHELHYFFCDLRAAVCGCLKEDEQRHAVTYYEFDGDFNEYPVLSEFAVTYRCNLQCQFCYVGDTHHPELGTGDAKKILYKILHEAQVPSVSFTGGEPLLRKDICELIQYASGIGLWTNLITNGTLITDTMVIALKNAGLSSVQISIEGPNSDVHDSITGQNGSFASTIEGIERMREAGIPIHTNTTVSRMNLEYLKGIVTLVKNLGLQRLSMNLCIPCGSARVRPELWVAYKDIGDQIVALKEHAARTGVTFLWYSPVPVCTFNPIAHGLGNKSCAAITGLLSVDPMGNIIPCSSWRTPVASLLRRRFKDIWKSKFISYFKNADYAPDSCHGCLEFDVCKGACPLYWSACGERELHDRA